MHGLLTDYMPFHAVDSSNIGQSHSPSATLKMPVSTPQQFQQRLSTKTHHAVGVHLVRVTQACNAGTLRQSMRATRLLEYDLSHSGGTRTRVHLNSSSDEAKVAVSTSSVAVQLVAQQTCKNMRSRAQPSERSGVT